MAEAVGEGVEFPADVLRGEAYVAVEEVASVEMGKDKVWLSLSGGQDPGHVELVNCGDAVKEGEEARVGGGARQHGGRGPFRR